MPVIMETAMNCRINIGKYMSLILSVALTVSEASVAIDMVYDRDPVNGHQGFLSAWRVTGVLDKLVIVVKGYDTLNADHPVDDLNNYSDTIMQLLMDSGFDIVVFDFVNGGADLKQNADNLSEFIRYLDDLIFKNGVSDRNNDGHPDYELAVIGGSMGGIVTRTMFVQKDEAMGVDTFVTIDSPHHGVHMSPYLTWATEFIDSIAGHQMLYGDDAYFKHYDWLRSIENSTAFRQRVIDPIHTAAIALSDGESEWHLDFVELVSHTEFHDVSSYIENGGIQSDFVPYHSAMNMDNTGLEVLDQGTNYKELKYTDTRTSYFDLKIRNSRDLHGGPNYAIRQAVDFVIENSGQPEASAPGWLIPILNLLLQ